MMDALDIRSPKRSKRLQAGWEGFFPYYAGYPEVFANALLSSANLAPDAVVFDPWNGSGTTTYTASELGMKAVGFDINPVMVVVARARLLPVSEADSIEPLAQGIVRAARPNVGRISGEEPLCAWFTVETAASIRSLERSIAKRLLGRMTLTTDGANFDNLSGLAATFYVALFNVCRALASSFRSSNPTWVRLPKQEEARINVAHRDITDRFLANLKDMVQALTGRAALQYVERGVSELKVADTTTCALQPESVDIVLTSPPYCTRIDYAAATRVELAVVAPLTKGTPDELSRRMVGSTKVSKNPITVSPKWGPRCVEFLEQIRSHPSKASAGYYYQTHLDYFDKMERSIEKFASALRPNGRAIMVVQDSYYKDIHNDLPSILTEIAAGHELALGRREDFFLRRSMSGINPHTRLYGRSPGAVEAVLCFSKTDN
jgi:DNA modification methylase